MNLHADRLQAAFARLARMLDDYARGRGHGEPPPPPPDVRIEGSALDMIGDVFDLSSFERSVLALAAGAEMSGEIGRLCALAHGDTAMPYPTLLLALALFAKEDGASHAAFAPAAPLCRYRLVLTDGDARSGRLHRRLGAADALLATLAGEPMLDPLLDARLEPIAATALLPGETAFVAQLAEMARAAPEAIVHLSANPSQRVIALAAAAATELGLMPLHLPLSTLSALDDRAGFLALWSRDRLAMGGALIVSFDEPGAEAQTVLTSLIATAPGPMLLVGQGATTLADRAASPVLRVPVPPPDPRELAEAIAATLALPDARGLIEVTRQFRLPRATIESSARVAIARTQPDAPALLPALRAVLRDQVRDGMTGLADRIAPRLTLDDLVVPPDARAVLDQVVARQRHRRRVIEDWGFGGAGGGPQGMSVVFSGPTGTGKTMAAEAIAQALNLDLYRVDLSRIVDKYIGETEKRLAALFDAADVSDAVLLFDEADVLFGRRTEVRDSHDRYANLEVGYLLQRIEAFRGIAILTTNLPNAIDEAFARRFAFSLHFAFPSEVERRAIWQRAIPASAPAEGLDWDLLAPLALSGGQIRVVSVNAAMLAAEEGGAIAMRHIARALEADYAKQRRRLPAGMFSGWPQ